MHSTGITFDMSGFYAAYHGAEVLEKLQREYYFVEKY